MNDIILREASMAYCREIWEFREEILTLDAEDENSFAGCLSLDTCGSAEEWIRLCNLRKDIKTCREAGVAVPSTTYFAIRQSDERLVGVIDLRHHIDHPILGTWGGHCGYSVRPTERRKGYAKEMLRLNIENARGLGLRRLLVTCHVGNTASEKTIIACGGVLEGIIHVDGAEFKRYWIDV